MSPFPQRARELVGTHSGGTLIADTFAFYARLGADRSFYQLARDLAVRSLAYLTSEVGAHAHLDQDLTAHYALTNGRLARPAVLDRGLTPWNPYPSESDPQPF